MTCSAFFCFTVLFPVTRTQCFFLFVDFRLSAPKEKDSISPGAVSAHAEKGKIKFRR